MTVHCTYTQLHRWRSDAYGLMYSIEFELMFVAALRAEEYSKAWAADIRGCGVLNPLQWDPLLVHPWDFSNFREILNRIVELLSLLGWWEGFYEARGGWRLLLRGSGVEFLFWGFDARKYPPFPIRPHSPRTEILRLSFGRIFVQAAFIAMNIFAFDSHFRCKHS